MTDKQKVVDIQTFKQEKLERKMELSFIKAWKKTDIPVPNQILKEGRLNCD